MPDSIPLHLDRTPFVTVRLPDDGSGDNSYTTLPFQNNTNAGPHLNLPENYASTHLNMPDGVSIVSTEVTHMNARGERMQFIYSDTREPVPHTDYIYRSAVAPSNNPILSMDQAEARGLSMGTG